MRGHKYFNFPMFEYACDKLRHQNYTVISPHEIDLVWGFKPADSLEKQPVTVKMVDMVRRDVEAISLCDILVTLPGWKKSIGARAEVSIAKWLEKPIRSLASFKTEPKRILIN